MVKKIKFPLEMDSGIMVRTLEELKDNFNLEKVISHFTSGKLLTWLNDRYYEEEATQIGELSSSSVDFKQKLCGILNVGYVTDNEIDIEMIEKRNMKISKLKQYTDDETIIKNVDKVAFNQEELADLIDEEVTHIYLCGKKFTIPLSRENVTYWGVNNPIIVIKSTVVVDFSVKNITLKNIQYNDEYQNIVNDSTKNENVKVNYICATHKTSALLDFIMKNSDRKASSRLLHTICSELSELSYDVDKNAKSNVEVIKQANLVEAFNSYLNKIS